MNFLNILLAVFLGLFSIINAAAISSPDLATRDDPPSINFQLRTGCNFSVYVRQVIAEHPGARLSENCTNAGTSVEYTVPGNANIWYTPTPALKDFCGHSIKVARIPGNPVYQPKYNWALETNKISYDMSHINGNFFTEVARQTGGPRSPSPYARCEAGNDGSASDWHEGRGNPDCDVIRDVIGILC